MRTYLIMLSMLAAVSCGKRTHEHSKTVTLVPEILVPEQTESLRVSNVWVNLRDNSILDLRAVNLNNLQLADDILVCTGQVGNEGMTNGVPPRQVFFTGSNFEGSIQFGHLNYVNATDLRCRAFSKERYEYKIVGEFLQVKNVTWCLKNLCPQDGIEFYKLQD